MTITELIEWLTAQRRKHGNISLHTEQNTGRESYLRGVWPELYIEKTTRYLTTPPKTVLKI